LETTARRRRKALPAPFPPAVLLFSVSAGRPPASVVQASGSPYDAAWQDGRAALLAAINGKGLTGRVLRGDWSVTSEARTSRELRAVLGGIKRNYFRYGLALDKELRIAFTEQELNANAMLYAGNAVAHAAINEKNFSLYARTKYGQMPPIGFGDREQVFLF